jgi:hypothetical protein
MSAFNFIIDSVQNAKKQYVETFLFGETFKKELVNLIDAQTEFAKGQVTTSLAIAEAFTKNASEGYKQAVKKAGVK